MVLLKFLLLFMLTHLTTALNTNYPDVNKYPVNITNEGDEQTESFSKLETFEVDVFSASNVKTYFFSDFTANNSAKIIYTLPIGVRNKTFVTLKYGTDGHNVTVEFKSNITNDVPNPRDLEGLYIVYLIDQSSYQQLARAIRFRVVLKGKLLL